MRQGLDDDEHPLPFSLLLFFSPSNDFVIQMRARTDTDRSVARFAARFRSAEESRSYIVSVHCRSSAYVCSIRGADSDLLEF